MDPPIHTGTKQLFESSSRNLVNFRGLINLHTNCMLTNKHFCGRWKGRKKRTRPSRSTSAEGIHTEYTLSGGAATLIFIAGGADVVGSLFMRTKIHWNVVVPLTTQHWRTNSLRKSMLRFVMQLITRLRVAEPHRLGNLCLIGRILVDCKFQELAEELVELLVALLLLDNVCKPSETLFHDDFRVHSQNLSSAGPPASAQKKIILCLDMVTCWMQGDDCRTEVPTNRHDLALARNIFFSHFDITQCEALFRNHCFAERFGARI